MLDSKEEVETSREHRKSENWTMMIQAWETGPGPVLALASDSGLRLSGNKTLDQSLRWQYASAGGNRGAKIRISATGMVSPAALWACSGNVKTAGGNEGVGEER